MKFRPRVGRIGALCLDFAHTGGEGAYAIFETPLGDDRSPTGIRECASDDCPLVFVDSSRPGARRWCAMERCDSHKVRALRARQASEAT